MEVFEAFVGRIGILVENWVIRGKKNAFVVNPVFKIHCDYLPTT